MEKQLITPQDLKEYKWISSPSIRKNGEIAYVCKSINSEGNQYQSVIYGITFDGKSLGKLTDGNNDSLPKWSPSGEKLAFIRNENGKSKIWIKNKEGVSHCIETENGTSIYEWSPDSRYILCLSSEKRDSGEKAGKEINNTLFKSEGAGIKLDNDKIIYCYDTINDELVQLKHPNIDISSPVWHPDSKQIIYIGKNKTKSDVYSDLDEYNDLFIMNMETREYKKLTDHSLQIAQFHFSLKDETLFIIGNDREFGSGTQNKLYTMNLEDAKSLTKMTNTDIQLGNYILNDMKTTGAFASPIYLNKEENVLFSIGTWQGDAHIYAFSKNEKERQITSNKRDVCQFCLTEDKKYAIFISISAESPGELYKLDLETQEEVQLTYHNEKFLASRHIITSEEICVSNSNNVNVQGWLLKPTLKNKQEKMPLILYIHGGPHAMISNVYSHELQSLAAIGNAVLLVNPTGSFGYGQEFAKACRGDFGGQDYKDLMKMVDEVLLQYPFIDKKRLGVTGGSYGGLMTNWILGHSDKFSAGVSQRSITNWLSFYGMSDIGISYTEGIVGGNPWDDHELLWEKSPLAHVQNIQAPLLIIHGEMDYRCPVGQADQLYIALKRLGKETKLIRYPQSNHSFLKNGNPKIRVDDLLQVNNWFKKYLTKEKIRLPMPVAFLIENCLTSKLPVNTILNHLKNKKYDILSQVVEDSDMNFQERIDIMGDMSISWNTIEIALTEGYELKFLHFNGLKKLLRYRLNKREDDYIQKDNKIKSISLNKVEYI